jgi:hypothetical protein
MVEKILNPEYVDLEKTRVRFKIIREDGIESVAELTVPNNKRKGVNKYWDRIVDEFDIEEMRQKRNRIEAEQRNHKKHADEKRRTQEKVIELKTLFNEKTKVLELPFIRDAGTDIKSAIRRAPTKAVLDFIVTDITRKFMENQGMDYNDYLDYLDDLEEEAETT